MPDLLYGFESLAIAPGLIRPSQPSLQHLGWWIFHVVHIEEPLRGFEALAICVPHRSASIA
jgi:hypothetical protein